MSTDDNKLVLKINPQQQAVGGDKIEVYATAYIQQDSTISYPNPPVEIEFELPEGAGAYFDEAQPSTTASRKTVVTSGRIETPLYFYSEKAIANGTLTAYWKDDKDNTIRRQPFTFNALPGIIKPTNNFVAADGSSSITLQVVLNPGQDATIHFTEKTNTVTFDPPSVQVKSGGTATTKATSKVPGAYFVSTELGTVEIDFLAAGPLTATDQSLSTEKSEPTQLTLANFFGDVEGIALTFYMQLPQYKDSGFASLSFFSTGLAFADTVHFVTSDGSVVDPQANDIALPVALSDMTPLQYYVGAFYSKERNQWMLYGNDNPIFGLQ